MRTRLTDPDEISHRAADVLIGAALAVLTAVAVLVYLALTPGGAHRGALTALCAGWAALSGAMFLLPRRRLVASRHREPFFIAWSAAVALSIAVGLVLEGSPRSPLFAA